MKALNPFVIGAFIALYLIAMIAAAKLAELERRVTALERAATHQTP